ncbi:MAG TPA: NADH-quinone oxidoreductase subunit J, partial [Actinomycetes bacterium]|nr:NADH-quinone oxidoreductase subunit J [Actinomycetes bacterium]
MNGEAIVFWLLAPLSVLGAVGMLLSRKAVHCAIWLALTMICLAILYIAQEAVFLGIVQVVVYTGAIMMLFLFVLMIVGVDASDSLVETIRGQRFASLLGALGFAFLLVAVVGRVT